LPDSRDFKDFKDRKNPFLLSIIYKADTLSSRRGPGEVSTFIVILRPKIVFYQ